MERLKEKVKRLLDANFNRAREGLRVIEDIARFILDNRALTEEAKEIRSDIASIQRSLKETVFFRDTEHDAGTTLNSPTEEERSSFTDIVTANAKRAEESMRVIEEVLKLNDTELAKRAKELRYRIYIIESKILKALKDNPQ